VWRDRPQVKTIPEPEEDPSGEPATGVLVATSLVKLWRCESRTARGGTLHGDYSELSRNKAFGTVVFPADTLPSKAILISR
jgi:hypothetical protein